MPDVPQVQSDLDHQTPDDEDIALAETLADIPSRDALTQLQRAADLVDAPQVTTSDIEEDTPLAFALGIVMKGKFIKVRDLLVRGS